MLDLDKLAPKEMRNIAAIFRLIKSNKLCNLCSLFLHEGSCFKKFELGKIKIEHNYIKWETKSLKYPVSGMLRLTDDRDIVVVQKDLKPITFKMNKGGILSILVIL